MPASTPFRAAVLTISDRASTGVTDDLSGPALAELLAAAGFAVVERGLVPDDRDQIAAWLRRCADMEGIALLCTTGGTGLAPRDVTPEATHKVLDREVPGIAEAMRATSLQATPLAMLSRAVAGVRGRSLIINFPGSPKAVRECFAVVSPVLRHALELIAGEQSSHVTAPEAG